MFRWSKILCALVMVAVAYFGFAYLVAPSLFPPFFYADYKQARRSLEAIPGVTILDNWQHHDISMEDCGFTVRSGTAEPVRIDFYEREDWGARFNHLDGVILCNASRLSDQGYRKVYLDAADLAAVGIQLRTLADVLQHIDRIGRLAKSRPYSLEERELAGEWCHIFFNLATCSE